MAAIAMTIEDLADSADDVRSRTRRQPCPSRPEWTRSATSKLASLRLATSATPRPAVAQHDRVRGVDPGLYRHVRATRTLSRSASSLGSAGPCWLGVSAPGVRGRPVWAAGADQQPPRPGQRLDQPHQGLRDLHCRRRVRRPRLDGKLRHR